MLDRRKFFKLFAAGSAGLTAAGKLALAEDIANWMLSPQKTIFIPPEPKIISAPTAMPMIFSYVITYCGPPEVPWEASWVGLPHPDEKTRIHIEQLALKESLKPGMVRVEEIVPGDYRIP